MSKSSAVPFGEQQSPSPEYLQELFTRAVGAHQAGDHDAAEQLYRQLLDVRPENVNLLCNLALLYREKGELAIALAEMEKAYALDPENFGVNLNIGALHEDLGDLELAEASLRKALDLAPHDPRALNNLGKVLFGKGERKEALIFLQRAVAIYPDYALAQNNLGVLLGSLGQNEAALEAFHQAIKVEPDNPATLYNLGGALNLAGDLVGAAEQYRRILELDPGNDCARHMLAACSGDSTAAAPSDYVVDTFDRYAGHFEEQLIDRLDYRVPELLAEAVRSHSSGRRYARCLDLGCGTGLSGRAFAGLAGSLFGVDLSDGMLKRARGKDLYDSLHRADIVAFLERDESESFDLFVAADVFIYIGELHRVFAGIQARAAKDALLAFSIETADDGDFRLLPSGRYAQSPAYIDRLAEQFGMRMIHSAPCAIRKEQGVNIAGSLYILQVK